MNNFQIPTTMWIRDGKINISMDVPRWLLDEMEYKVLRYSGGSFLGGGDKNSPCTANFVLGKPEVEAEIDDE